MESKQGNIVRYDNSEQAIVPRTLNRSPSPLRHDRVAAMLWVVVTVGALGFAPLAGAVGDPLESKLKLGLTMDAVVALIGTTPDAESCKTTFGIRTCRLVWKKFFIDTRYEVDFLWGRLVSVRTCRNANTSCPSSKAE